MIDNDTILSIDLNNAKQALAECRQDLEDVLIAWLEARNRVVELTGRMDETDEA